MNGQSEVKNQPPEVAGGFARILHPLLAAHTIPIAIVPSHQFDQVLIQTL